MYIAVTFGQIERRQNKWKYRRDLVMGREDLEKQCEKQAKRRSVDSQRRDSTR
jgi:hypothetical protein